MKTNEILGKKVLDKNVKEVGKIAEINFDTKNFKLSGIYCSTGNPINKKYYAIKPSSIMALGDYLQISEVKEEIEQNMIDKVPKNDGSTKNSNEIINKKVLNCEGNDSGKVTDIEFDFEKQEITSLTVSKSTSFSKAKSFEISVDEILGFGDYMIINKVLNFEEEKTEAEEAEEDVPEEEKVKVDIE